MVCTVACIGGMNSIHTSMYWILKLVFKTYQHVWACIKLAFFTYHQIMIREKTDQIHIKIHTTIQANTEETYYIPIHTSPGLYRDVLLWYWVGAKYWYVQVQNKYIPVVSIRANSDANTNTDQNLHQYRLLQTPLFSIFAPAHANTGISTCQIRCPRLHRLHSQRPCLPVCDGHLHLSSTTRPRT